MYTQDQWLLQDLLQFYQNQDYLEKFKKIINREYYIENSSKILSIRIIYWFVTNFAKQHFTCYDLPVDNDNTKRFLVWENYKLTESSYSKQLFDAYCRHDRVLIPYRENNQLETTIAQMHFFKWVFVNKIIEYIENKYDSIEKDMNVRLNTVKRKPAIESDGTKTRKKREELSMNACKSLRKEVRSVKMTFWYIQLS